MNLRLRIKTSFENVRKIVHKGSYMSVQVQLNLLNELKKRDKCSASLTFYLFLATSLINSIIWVHQCKILFFT